MAPKNYLDPYAPIGEVDEYMGAQQRDQEVLMAPDAMDTEDRPLKDCAPQTRGKLLFRAGLTAFISLAIYHILALGSGLAIAGLAEKGISSSLNSLETAIPKIDIPIGNGKTEEIKLSFIKNLPEFDTKLIEGVNKARKEFARQTGVKMLECDSNNRTEVLTCFQNEIEKVGSGLNAKLQGAKKVAEEFVQKGIEASKMLDSFQTVLKSGSEGCMRLAFRIVVNGTNKFCEEIAVVLKQPTYIFLWAVALVPVFFAILLTLLHKCLRNCCVKATYGFFFGFIVFVALIAPMSLFIVEGLIQYFAMLLTGEQHKSLISFVAARWVYSQGPLQFLPAIMALVCSGKWFQTNKTKGIQWVLLVVTAIIVTFVAPLSFMASPGDKISFMDGFKLLFTTRMICLYIPLLWASAEIAYFACSGRMFTLCLVPMTLRDRAATAMFFVLYGIFAAAPVVTYYFSLNVWQPVHQREELMSPLEKWILEGIELIKDGIQI